MAEGNLATLVEDANRLSPELRQAVEGWRRADTDAENLRASAAAS